MKKQHTLLVLFPHPDDETVMSGGLIQQKLAAGWRVVVAILTHGERGQVHIHGRGRSLAAIREQELGRAVAHLGVEEYRIFEYPDGGLRRSVRWKKAVRRLVEEVDPQIVVTYDHSGFTGHPDHIAVSVEVLRLLRQHTNVRLWWVREGNGRIRIALSFIQALRKIWATLAHQSQGLWKKPEVWRWLLSRREYYSEVDLSKHYQHRYSEFSI